MSPDRLQNRGLGILVNALPIYLIPFLFGDEPTKTLFCILATVVSLASDIVPVSVTAFVPVILIQLTGLMEPDKLGSAFMNLEVLTASSLFVIVIVGDRTAVFSKAVLRVICAIGVDAPLLFAYLMTATFVCTFLVPSGIVVILSTVLVERFMATIEEDLCAIEQRGLRASRLRNSSDTADGETSTRTGSRSKARRCSSPTRMFRDRSRYPHNGSDRIARRHLHSPQPGPPLVKQYKVHQPDSVSDIRDEGPRKIMRKTSFDPYTMGSPPGTWAPHLPARRIRSFSEQGNVKRSSILKDTKAGETVSSPDAPSTPTMTIRVAEKYAPDFRLSLYQNLRRTHSAYAPLFRRPSILKPTGTARRSSLCFKRKTAAPDIMQSGASTPSGPSTERKIAAALLSVPVIRRQSILKPSSGFRTRRASVPDYDPSLNDRRLAELDDVLGTRRPKPLQLVEGNRMFAERPMPTTSTPRTTLLKQDMTASFESQQSSLSDTRKLQAICVSLRAALLLGAALTAIFGNLASFWNVPARTAILQHLSNSHFSLLFMKATNAVAMGESTFDVCILHFNQVPDKFDESIREDLNKCAVARLKELGSNRFEEALVAYWFLFFPFYYASNISRSIDAEKLEAPFLGLSAIAMTMLPRRSKRFWSLHRLAPWDVIRTRMPWGVIVMYGSVSSLARLAEASPGDTGPLEHNVVKYIFERVGRTFWRYKSVQVNQLLLSLLAAVLSEILSNATLSNLIVPIVINIASESDTPPVFFVIPVGVAASANVILPVSLPLLMLRESLDIPCSRMIATGLVLKFVAVVTVVLTTNTLGRLTFLREGDIGKEQHLKMINGTLEQVIGARTTFSG
ncbi:unnamed protein product [Ixodes hexagonus]